MASIIVDLSDDIKKIQSLKEEIQQVKEELSTINVNVHLDIKRDMESRLKALTDQYDALVQKVAQAEAKIAESTARINKSAETIIKAQEQLSKAASGQNVANAQGASGSNMAATNAQTASVEAQAKAYDELKDSIEGYLGTMEGNARFLAESQIRIKAINSNISLLEKSIKSQGYATEKQSEQLAKYNMELAEIKLNMQEARRELNTGLRINMAGSGSLKQLQNELLQMQRVWDNMTESVRNSPIGQEFASSMKVLNQQVSELEQTMGRYQRNVGNYASGWNGLSMSIQQIGRELPSLAMGWNTFFLAISNNLPILTDEIKRAKDEYNNLKKAGQQATPVWKQVVSSLLSWQTALTVGITLLTLYGKEIVEWVKGMFNAGNSLETLVDIQKEMNDVMSKGTKNAQGDVTRLKLLYNATQDVTRSTEERTAAVKELQDKYPSYFGNISKEELLAGRAADAYTRLSQAIVASARARAAQDKMTENASKILDNEQKINEAYVRLESAEERLRKERELLNRLSGNPEAYDFQIGIVNAMQSNVDEIYDEIAGYRSAIRETNKLQSELAKNIDIESLLFNPSERKEKENAKEIKSPFGRSELDFSKEIEKRIQEAEERTMEASLETYEMSSAEQSAMNRYLSEYGTFQQKRLAITQEYQQKIAAATTEGDKLSLQKQMEEALSSINMDELKESINWELVFSDLENVSKKSLSQLKKQLKEFKDSSEYKDMTVEQKKVIDEALNDIQSAIIDKGGLLGDLPSQLDELAKAQDELNAAQEEYNRVMKEGTDAQKEAATKRLNNAQKGVQNAQSNVEQSTKKTTDNFLTLADAITQLGSSSEMTLTEVGQLAGGIADTFAEAGSKIGGIIGSAFSVLDVIGKQGLDGFIGNVLDSVFNAAYGAWDTVFGWTGIDFGGESDPHLEEDLERLTQANQDLEQAINNLSGKMEEAAVADASDIYEQQKQNLEESMRNTQEMMRRSGAAYSNGFLGMGGTHSSNKRIDDAINANEWRRISEIVGKTVDSAGDFWNLTSEEMWRVATEAADLYSKIKSYADDGYSDASQYMDEYIRYWQELQELQDAYNEKLTSVSFDTIRNDFRESLLDMESDVEDFTDNFEQMMQESIIESLMTSKYDALLQNWYREFAESMSDGSMSASEQANLKSLWDSIVNQGLADRDTLKGLFGWDTDASQQQSATARGFDTMAQDQASELNGRFTALYESSLRQENIQQGISNIAEETRSIIAQSYLELQQISENTGAIIVPIQKMQKDIEQVKQNTSRI